MNWLTILDALVDDEFGEHQQGDADEKADMGLYVQQKGYRHPLQQAAVPPAQQQQGQPADPLRTRIRRLMCASMSPDAPGSTADRGGPQDREKLLGSDRGRAEEIGRGDRPVMRHDGTTLLCDKCAIRPPPAPLPPGWKGRLLRAGIRAWCHECTMTDPLSSASLLAENPI